MKDLKFISPTRFEADKHIRLFLPKVCPRNAHVLDAGCGTGIYSELFSELKIGKSYVGIDINPREEWKLYSKLKHPKVRFKRGDLRKINEKSDSFDFVISVSCLEHIEEDKRALKDIYRVLKKNRYCLFIVPTRYYWICQLGRHGYHHYSKKQVMGLIKSTEFNIVKIKRLGGIVSLLCNTLDIWTSHILLLFPYMIYKILGKNLDSKKMSCILNSTIHFHLHFKLGRKLHMVVLRTISWLNKIFYFFSTNYLVILKK